MDRPHPLVPALVLTGLLALGLTPTPAEAQSWREMSSARQVWDRSPLTVQVQYGAGTLNLRPAASPTLYRMELRYDEESFAPITEYDEEAGTLRLGVRSLERSRRTLNLRDGAEATIALSREVPFDLSVEFGAGEANMELGGVALRRLSVSTGASETSLAFSAPNPQRAERVSIEAGAADLRVSGLGNLRAQRLVFQGGVGATVLDFSGAWDGDLSAGVQMGIGSVVLRVPRALGLEINRSSFLTTFNAPGMERQANRYRSAGWESAAHKLTIDLNAALGSVQIEWLD